MIKRLIKFEFKNLIRDRMTLMFFVYPFLVGGVGNLFLSKNDYEASMIQVIIISLSIISGVVFGAMGGFSIMDDRDDHVFTSINISPLNIRSYVWFKVLFVSILGFFSNLIIYFMIDMQINFPLFVIITALSSLQIPIHAFIINALASNKVEGFMAMKGSGFLLIFPVISFFFIDWKQWIFAFAPAFWVFKAFQFELFKPLMELGLVDMYLNTSIYLLIGFIYNILLITWLYRVFKKKYL